MNALAGVALQGPLTGLTASPVGKLFVAVVAVLVIVFVARIVLSIAWKVALVAAVLLGGAYLVTAFL